jgi:hypothetical protein
MVLPVSSHRLRDREVCLLPGSPGEKCTLLPFFDSGGVVQRVMVVSSEVGELRFFAPSEAAVRIPLWGPIQLASSSPALRVLEYEDLEPLTSLWHYDPWWLLTSPDESRSERTQLLKQTNCAGRFDPAAGNVQRLLYARDLTRVAWLVCTSGQSTTWKRLRTKLLPQRAAAVSGEERSSVRFAWRLAPFWRS